MKLGARIGTGVALTLAGSLLAACGSSSGGTGTAGAPKSTAPAPTGSEVKIMQIAVKNNPVLTQEQLLAAGQARVDSINAAGGLNGHKLTMIACDSNLDPNQEQACIDKAISEKVAAVVGSTLVFSDFTKLNAAKIPLIGNQGLTPNELANPTSWGFAANISWFQGMAAVAAKDGLKSAGVCWIDTDTGKFSGETMQAGLKKAGVAITGTVAYSPTASDHTAEAVSLIKGNPEGLLISGTAEGVIPLMKAVKQAGYQGQIYTISPDVTPKGLKALGGLGDGIHVIGIGRFLTDTANAKVAAYLSDMKNYAPDAVLDENGELGWSGVDLFATVMAKATSFEGSDVIAAFQKLTTPVEAGTFGPFVGVGTSIDPAYPHLFNTNYIVGTVKDGAITATGDFQNLSAG